MNILDLELAPIAGPNDEFYILGVDQMGGFVRIPKEYLVPDGDPVNPIDPYSGEDTEE